MPPFRDWPVCWLFLLATATADVAMLSGSTDTPWRIGLVVGQMLLLGLWVVYSPTHRLLRGAFFVAGLGGLSWLAVVVIEPFFWQRWSVMIGVTAAIQGTVAAAGAATAWAGRFAPGQKATSVPSERLQYPLIEIFGWTIVVASASVLLRGAPMEQLMSSDFASFWLTGCLVVGVWGALLHDYRRWPRRVVVPTALGLPLLFWLVWRDTFGGEATVMFAAQLYLATYLFCRWLDADPRRTFGGVGA